MYNLELTSEEYELILALVKERLPTIKEFKAHNRMFRLKNKLLYFRE